MNANEQAIYDAITFLLDNRLLLKTALDASQLPRMNKALKGLVTEFEKSINLGLDRKGVFDDAKPWAGTFKSHNEYRNQR